MHFASRVLSEWENRRGENFPGEVGAAPWESLKAPALGQFAGPVTQEFAEVRREERLRAAAQAAAEARRRGPRLRDPPPPRLCIDGTLVLRDGAAVPLDMTGESSARPPVISRTFWRPGANGDLRPS